MQLRGPALKGRYAYGCRPFVFSGRNLSGSNFSGSGKYSGSLWRAYAMKETLHPAGITVPSAN